MAVQPVRVYLTLARPKTLIPLLVIGVVFGLAGAHQAGIKPSMAVLLHVLLAAWLLTVANFSSNVINEIADAPQDRIHPEKRNRPIVSGQLDPQKWLSIAIIAWGLCTMAALLFLPRLFSILYVAVLGFAWVYSFWPRFKRTFPMNYAVISTPRGALGIAAAWVVYGALGSYALWTILAVTVPYVLLTNETRNIDDAESDRMDGVRTVTVMMGERAGRIMSGAGFVYPSLALLFLGLYGRFPWLILLVFPPLFVLTRLFRWRGRQLWTAFYGYYAVLALALGMVYFFI
jgi:4-hydroxybenzoate polyprenyltransferase